MKRIPLCELEDEWQELWTAATGGAGLGAHFLRKELLRLHEKFLFTLLYVTYERDDAFEVGNRVIVVRDGQIEKSGSSSEVWTYLETAIGEAELFS